MKLHELQATQTKKPRRRKGRGYSSGFGTFAGRGCKGQNSRSGGGVRLGFEGGQSPLLKRLPKLKGFKNPNRVETSVVDLSALGVFSAGEAVTLETLKEKQLIPARATRAKILANGECTVALTLGDDVQASAAVRKALGA
ncbi:50S ribosomal protein L15 [Candidatus Peribacteria bacterium]|nr:50S ribosomal protein L15 [Candidatus Peribacteria bacterium]